MDTELTLLISNTAAGASLVITRFGTVYIVDCFNEDNEWIWGHKVGADLLIATLVGLKVEFNLY